MNNEIGRKITSLTLMTIMVAGGMTFAAPGVIPEAYAANDDLFVSAENDMFENYMSGPQVIEVVVRDPNISETDEANGYPDVTVNGKDLRLAQASDGAWYGYFADKAMANAADGTTSVAGQGLDFGTICEISDSNTALGFEITDADGIAVPSSTCGAPDSTNNMNVVREAKGLSGHESGQINVAPNNWPFIQLYELNPTGNVIVQYNKGGDPQSVELTFDTVDDFANLQLDREGMYPKGAQVHTTITDAWLNIDPTDEDSWTFGTLEGTTYYQVFNENGDRAGDNVAGGVIDISGSVGDLMCGDACILLINPDQQGTDKDVITIQDNDDSEIRQIDAGSTIKDFQTVGTSLMGEGPVTFTEQGPNSGMFASYDESDVSAIVVTGDAMRRTSASIDYNETPVSILVGAGDATIDIQPQDDEWNSGEEIPVVLVDMDANKNTRADEDLLVSDPSVGMIPSLKTGNPYTLGSGDAKFAFAKFTSVDDSQVPSPVTSITDSTITTATVQLFSDRAIIDAASTTNVDALIIDFGTNVDVLTQTLLPPEVKAADVNSTLNSVTINADLKDLLVSNVDTNFHGFNFYNQDVSSLGGGDYDVYFLHAADGSIIGDDGVNQDLLAKKIVDGADARSGLERIDDVTAYILATAPISDHRAGLAIVASNSIDTSSTMPIVADFFSYGFMNDGELGGERVSNQIIRIEVEESGDNTSTFEGSLEYTMINQLNILDADTYTGISPIADDPSFIVIEDYTDEDSVRVNYLDLGSDGELNRYGDQQEAPSHSGVVSFDSPNYKIADTVTITLEDSDLNVDSDLIDIFTISSLPDTVGSAENSIKLGDGSDLGRVLDVTFDDTLWTTPEPGECATKSGVLLEDLGPFTGLADTGFTLIETSTSSGVFVGNFQIQSHWCNPNTMTAESTTGLDLEVNYVDFRDGSGEIIEVGASAGIRATTGSVSLDRTVYPVPFGVPDDFGVNTSSSPENRSLFPIHQTGMNSESGLQTGEYLSNGDLSIHIRVNDADFDTSGGGENSIAQNTIDGNGPVKLSVIRGASTVVLGYAGGSAASDGVIDVGDEVIDNVRQFGPIVEIAPDAGIFEVDIGVRYTDGPADTKCPDTEVYTNIAGNDGNGVLNRFSEEPRAGTNYCILQGDILQVEYTDPTDASGDPNTVTDSATFDLRNGVLQSDKSVYLIGSDIILTLIEPDFDLDNDQAETYDLDLIEWDSDAATVSMGNASPETAAAFDPEPSNFRETGDSTGIFQIVIEVPGELEGDRLDRGEEIELEYTDWGPSGSDYVGDEDEDVNLTVFTSNFGATVELDQKVYTWTDKVYVTIVAPDHNYDSDLVDEIGNTDLDPIKVSTRGFDLDNYKLVETGTDTGIFTGEVILTGFTHDADGDTTTGTDGNDVVSRSPTGSGPTDGFLSTDDDDGITVSFEFSEDETIVGSALIRWNIGEVQWLDPSYPASGTGVVRIIDPDMNLDPEAVDNFDVDVWSSSDAGGIDLTVTETNESTGIFEGIVFFTTTDESSGHRLRVSEADTVTASYEDNTLPDPYTTADELDITATSVIGSAVNPLERAVASNLRIVDAFDNSLDTVTVGQQVQVTADLASGQNKDQPFAYLVQIQDEDGVTVALAWITGSLTPEQSFSPATSWTPSAAGAYTVTAFVWESIDNPTALSPPVTTTITVS